MDIADDVERAMLGLAIIPEGLADDFRRLDFRQRLQDVNMPEAFPLQSAQ